jgi:DsbC/DsbD-like thiol-disulfide interchange protein
MKPTLLLCVAIGGLALPAPAGPVRDGPVEADLFADVVSITPGTPFTVALRMKLDPPWHAYWTNPGDSGLPPSVEWSLPDGFTVGDLQFPVPKAIPTPPFMTYGHEGEILFLATVTPPAEIDQDRVVLAAEADWLVCNELCIPGFAELELSLPVRPDPQELHPVRAGFIGMARRKLPVEPDGWQLQALREADRYVLAAVPPDGFGLDGASAYFFPAAPGVVRHVAPQSFQREGAGFRLVLVPDASAEAPPAQLAGVLVIQGRAGPSAALRVAIPFSGATASRLSNPERNTP